MSERRVAPGWLSNVRRGGGPIYLAMLHAMEAALRAGDLQPGDQLPPQRHVAEALGVDITTVTRAYGEARRRGWIEGAVGRGTFVSRHALDDDPGLVDLSMNLPPPPEGVSLGDLLRETAAAILQRTDAARLMSYHPGLGTPAQQMAGASWLAPCLGEVEPGRLLVTPGAQTALAAILSRICSPGDKLLVEPLTYPGLRHIAAQAGVTLLPCPVDDDGLRPEDLDRICREHAPVAVYLVPTLQNPTATTMTLERRQAVGRIATARDLWIIEDDPYSRLTDAPLAAIATFAPARSFYVATLAKCLSPGLRVAYLVCPSTGLAADLADSVRALALMPPPMMAAIATAWIREGRAEELLAGIRSEARARRQIASEFLPLAHAATVESIHVWLDLPASWQGATLRSAAQARGLSLVTAEAFATGAEHRNGVRISLGGPESREVLAAALRNIAELVAEHPDRRRLVV